MARLIVIALALFLTACNEAADPAPVPTPVADDTTKPEPEPCPMPAHFPVAAVPPISGYQGEWVKQADKVVPVSTDPLWFDTGYTFAQMVVHDDATGAYLTYYTGGTLDIQPGRETFGVALSNAPDGPRIKHFGNGLRGSLFNLGEEGRFDSDRAWGMGSVIKDGGIFKTWYVGDSDPTNAHTSRVGYATSPDGFIWTKHYADTPTGAVFEDMTGCPGGLRGMLRFPVLKDTDGYYGFYYTFNSSDIRVAYSPDGINDWTIQGAINLPFEVTGIGNVIKEDGVYYLAASRTDLKGVVVFVSVDRTNWAFYDELTVSDEYAWQSAWMAYPHLFKDHTGWYLYYFASDTLSTIGEIGMAKLVNPPIPQ